MTLRYDTELTLTLDYQYCERTYTIRPDGKGNVEILEYIIGWCDGMGNPVRQTWNERFTMDRSNPLGDAVQAILDAHEYVVESTPTMQRYTWEGASTYPANYYPLASDNARFYLGNLESNGNGFYAELPISSGSHYSGSTVERANYRVLIDEYSEYVIPYYGGHGTFGALVPYQWLTASYDPIARELRERINALSDYPLLDDDELYQLETEILDDAWTGDGWIVDDLKRALCDLEIDHTLIDYIHDDLTNERLRGIAESVIYDSPVNGVYIEYIHESPDSVYVDVDALAPLIVDAIRAASQQVHAST